MRSRTRDVVLVVLVGALATACLSSAVDGEPAAAVPAPSVSSSAPTSPGSVGLDANTAPTDGPTPRGIAVPRPGSCWDSPYTPLPTPTAPYTEVGCTVPHQTQTLVVLGVPETGPLATDALPVDLDLADPVVDAAFAECEEAVGSGIDDALQLTDVAYRAWALGLVAFLPATDQWRQGERWIRCDVAMTVVNRGDDALARIGAQDLSQFRSTDEVPDEAALCLAVVGGSPGLEYASCAADFIVFQVYAGLAVGPVTAATLSDPAEEATWNDDCKTALRLIAPDLDPAVAGTAGVYLPSPEEGLPEGGNKRLPCVVLAEDGVVPDPI